MWDLRIDIWTGILFLVFILQSSHSVTAFPKTSVFLNQTSSQLILPSTWNLRAWTQLSFRTCSSDGELLSQQDSDGGFLRLNLHNGSLLFSWNVTNETSQHSVQGKYNTNKWYTVSFKYHLGVVHFDVAQGRTILYREVVANSTFNQYLLSNPLNSAQLVIGRTIVGCVNQGPGVDFNLTGIVENHVIWNNCSLSSLPGCSLADLDGDDCKTLPCLNGGSCIDGRNTYTCQCPHNFNGTNCENDLRYLGCSIEPCLNQGTCLTIVDIPSGRPYRCSCASGYTGADCELEIDDCRAAPCEFGTCINIIGDGYQCNCSGTGYDGANCTHDIDECLRVNCGSGTCYNYPGSYSCQCPIGFYGDLCQDDINECESSPCQHDGTCHNLMDKFSCMCQTGFSGVYCEHNIDDCEGVVCQSENATCKDLVNNHQCVCKDGFTGTDPNCVDIDECASKPCVVDQSLRCLNMVNMYSCQCRPGFTGEMCEIDINECSILPCVNNATCVQGINSYQCQCLDGYTGKNCSEDINDCSTESCHNGGTCNDQVNGFTCDCIPGWTGDVCSLNIDECAGAPCLNNATCHDYLNYYNCSCVIGFQGFTCDDNINDCQVDPCLNNGQCVDLINDYRCDCNSRYMGKNCSETYNACIDLLPCKNGGTCNTEPPERQFTCTCLTGFNGADCTQNIDDCLINNCQSYEKCYDGIANYTCGCPKGYEGLLCDIDTDECANHECQNEAICINGTGDYTCDCKQKFFNLTEYVPGRLEFFSGYTGHYCSEDINECRFSPCLNGGQCDNSNGTFQCLCPGETSAGLPTGFNCELLTSYCAVAAGKLGRLPCYNGGTCRSKQRGYECHCAPGWTGLYCNVDILECASSPCGYGGTCNEGINGYNCSCIPGISGDNCEININECISEPCQYGGQCLDQINQYICNCTDTGFKGDNCENNIDDCESSPCYHGGTCEDGIKEYTCNCYDGYSGVNCEIDIKECETKPCLFGGTCLERSNQTLYEMSEPGFSNFSYATAAGYTCYCIPGITGSNCDVNINECESTPCKNSGTCHDFINSYSCSCASGFTDTNCGTNINECEIYKACMNGAKCQDLIADYSCACTPFTTTNGGFGGKNCSVRLVGCDSGSLCQQGSPCVPNYDETSLRHDYTCDCLHGYTGRYCNVSTTFTFRDNASVKTQSQQYINQISFRFRTSLDEGILMSYQPADSGAGYLHVQIQKTKIKVEYQNEFSKMINSIPVNDKNWHNINISLDQNITVMLDSDLCHQTSDCTLVITNLWTSSSPGHLYFGYSDLNVMVTRKPYIGCMQDVTINDVVLFQTGPKFLFSSSVQKECPRREQCGPYTCSRHGDCKDLWYAYQCNCYRPYLGTNCTNNYISATFAKDGMISFASFSVPESLKTTLTNDFDLSLFIQTRQDNSVIMYIGNTNSAHLTFLTLEMINGKLGGRISFCDIKYSFTTQLSYQDGEKYFVNLSVKSGIFTFVVKNDIVNKTLINYTACPLQANIMYLGGRTPSFSVPGRRRREITSITNITDFSTSLNFEGVIQDIEINEKKFEFYPTLNDSVEMISSSNLTKGAQSTHDVCQDSPCYNSGTCTDIVFNDFVCTCPSGYIGKDCSSLDFCNSVTCPNNAICQSRIDGYECISKATFNRPESLVKYQPNVRSTTNLNTLSLYLITHSEYSAIFVLQHREKFLKVRLAGGYIQLNYKLTSGMPDNLNLEAKQVNDGEWYQIEADFETTRITIRIKENDTIIDEASVSVQSLNVTSMINDGADILVGGVDAQTYRRGWEQPFKGCLDEMRLGSVLLPFFSDDLFVNNTSQEKFIATEINSLTIGCENGNSCLRRGSMCLHGSDCVNNWNNFECECSTGFQGMFCQSNVDECLLMDCNPGKCVDRVGYASCQCPRSWTGDRCETDVMFCTNESCENGGVCYELSSDFGCNCSGIWTGKTCNILSNSSCQDVPCKNSGMCTDLNNNVGNAFNCSCNPGYQGSTCEIIVDYCNNMPCNNGGNCSIDLSSSNFYKCTCPPGFNGMTCNNNIDDCESHPCVHGICDDGDNEYFCNCTEGWTGRSCSENIDECDTITPCQHGVCLDNNGSYICYCTGSGFYGAHCENDVDECATNKCKNVASCENTVGSYSCNCTLGYTGPDCYIPDCSANQCDNNSTCITTSNKEWVCQCLQFYFGKQCEIAGPCTYGYCNDSNTDYCQQDEEQMTYTCICKPGWEGMNCTDDIDECLVSDVCANSGTCENTVGGFKCHCAPGFNGTTCQTDIDDCKSQDGLPLCENNGTCLDKVNGFTCSCNNGFTGKTCEADIDECLVNPCKNTQPCKNTIGSFICSCNSDYVGPQCQFDNPCKAVLCQNDGSCNVTLNDNMEYEPVCYCINGYEGVRCEKADPSVKPIDDGVDVWVIIGPIIAVIIIIIIIAVVVFLISARNKRANRGQYCPSQQERAGARVELGNVLKRPPQERLI